MDTWNCGGSWPTISPETTKIETQGTYSLPEEHDIGFDQPVAVSASWYRRIDNSFLNFFVIIRAFAFDASLRGKTSMSFDNLLRWDSRSPLKRVNVLGEACVEKAVCMQHFDE
jgi:hypothetical protein